uniref:Kinesin family member 6 n=1 Tax=Bos indicus x Bos taurus TaxID=30522 RepID=A0A4W2C319_BOBOX
MVKQTIQIFARVKPTVRKQQQGIYSIDEDEKLTPSLEIILPRDLADGFVNNKRESYRFNAELQDASNTQPLLDCHLCLWAKYSPSRQALHLEIMAVAYCLYSPDGIISFNPHF